MTRQEYLDSSTEDGSFRSYYSQFVDASVLATVSRAIGVDRIKASKDPHFNDISLRLWDALPMTKSISDKMRALGDGPTLAGKVCVYKTAADQIREGA